MDRRCLSPPSMLPCLASVPGSISFRRPPGWPKVGRSRANSVEVGPDSPDSVEVGPDSPVRKMRRRLKRCISGKWAGELCLPVTRRGGGVVPPCVRWCGARRAVVGGAPGVGGRRWASAGATSAESRGGVRNGPEDRKASRAAMWRRCVSCAHRGGILLGLPPGEVDRRYRTGGAASPERGSFGITVRLGPTNFGFRLWLRRFVVGSGGAMPSDESAISL